jgi:hypothetical protein
MKAGKPGPCNGHFSKEAIPMQHLAKERTPSASDLRPLLAYVADLELEVDRLRKQGEFVRHEVRGTLKQIRRLCADAAGAGDAPPLLAEIEQTAKQLAAVLRDLQEPPGYHPARD